VIIVLFADRGVEYEFQVSAKNAIDFGTPAVATIHTPEGGNNNLTTATTTTTTTTTTFFFHFHVTGVILKTFFEVEIISSRSITGWMSLQQQGLLIMICNILSYQ